MNPKLLLSSLVLAAALLPGCAAPGPTYVVAGQPPPAQVEVVPAARPGWYWVRGHWAWRDGRNVWIPGHWVRARQGGAWVEGHYENRAGGYVWVEGYWR